MTRAREFDPAKALDDAMRVFWRKGYYATSIDDLVEATGVSRYGLYAEYENKRGLFLASLDHYRASVIERLATVLRQPGASLGAIRAFITDLGALAAKPSGRLGCLLWNTASEVAPHDKAAALKVADFTTMLTSGFRSALGRAAARGELATPFDVEREADFLTGVAQTLSVMARSHTRPRAIAGFVAISLSTLD